MATVIYTTTNYSNTNNGIIPIGYEFDYKEITATTTITPGANTGASVSLIAGNAITLDGSTNVEIRFFVARADLASTSGFVIFQLFDSSTDICRLATNQDAHASPIFGSVILRGSRIPANGSHTYTIKCWQTGSGTLTINSDTGAPAGDVDSPTYIRVVKAF